jgi:hypothetical protein
VLTPTPKISRRGRQPVGIAVSSRVHHPMMRHAARSTEVQLLR